MKAKTIGKRLGALLMTLLLVASMTVEVFAASTEKTKASSGLVDVKANYQYTYIIVKTGNSPLKRQCCISFLNTSKYNTVHMYKMTKSGNPVTLGSLGPKQSYYEYVKGITSKTIVYMFQSCKKTTTLNVCVSPGTYRVVYSNSLYNPA